MGGGRSWEGRGKRKGKGRRARGVKEGMVEGWGEVSSGKAGDGEWKGQVVTETF